MGFRLQARDVAILKDVFRYRVQSYEQIRTRLFADAHCTACSRRIRALCAAGYLKSFSHVVGDRSYRYVETTDRGWLAVRNQFTYDMNRPHLKSESPLHDIRFADVASRFEELGCLAEFWPENLIRSSTALSETEALLDLLAHETDAALVVTAPNGRRYLYALEYELNKKAPARYKEKLASYYACRDLQGLIYVSATQEILNSLARQNAEICREKRSILFQALESDVLNSSGKLRFQGHQNAVIEFT